MSTSTAADAPDRDTPSGWYRWECPGPRPGSREPEVLRGYPVGAVALVVAEIIQAGIG